MVNFVFPWQDHQVPRDVVKPGSGRAWEAVCGSHLMGGLGQAGGPPQGGQVLSNPSQACIAEKVRLRETSSSLPGPFQAGILAFCIGLVLTLAVPFILRPSDSDWSDTASAPGLQLADSRARDFSAPIIVSQFLTLRTSFDR